MAGLPFSLAELKYHSDERLHHGAVFIRAVMVALSIDIDTASGRAVSKLVRFALH